MLAGTSALGKYSRQGDGNFGGAVVLCLRKGDI